MPKLIHSFFVFLIFINTAISLAAHELGCDLSILEITPTCNDNGTPSNPADDFYTVFVNASVIAGGTSGTFEILVSGGSIGTFNYDIGGNITLPADGTVVTIVFADSDDLNCSQVDVVGPLTTCSDQCALTITQANPVCNDNGTPSDSSDDFYTISVNASVANGGSQFNVFDGTNTNTFSYGAGGIITIPATATMANLIFSDVVDPNCTANQIVGPLTTCSDQCVLTITQANPVCDNNGTPSDPSDDFYIITVDASAVNGGSQFNVFDGTNTNTFSYNAGGNITLPATGTMANLIFSDVADPNCTANQMVGPLTTCSNQCELTITQINPTCNNNGTSSDPADDFYTVFVNATAINASSQFNVFDGNNTTTLSYGVGGNVILSATGTMATLFFSDAVDPNCTASQSVGPLTTCSDDCLVTLQITTNPTTGIYEASMTVITVGAVLVESGKNVVFQGAQTVELEVGFEVEANATFEAKNEPCSEQ